MPLTPVFCKLVSSTFLVSSGFVNIDFASRFYSVGWDGVSVGFAPKGNMNGWAAEVLDV